MKHTFILIFLFVSILSHSQGITDGFFKEKGQGSIVLGYGYQDTPTYFAGTSEISVGRDLTYYSLFADYGLSDAITISLSLPYLITDVEQDIQDLSIVAKYLFYEKMYDLNKLQLSTAIGFATPIADYQTGGLFAIGQKATTVSPRFIAHYAWESRWFITAQTGFAFSFQEVPSSIPAALKVGRATNQWYFDGFLEFQKALGGIDYLETPSPQNFREFGVDIFKAGGSIYKKLTSTIGLSANYGYVISGRNVFKGPGYGVGLVVNY